ncbi:MAG: DUF4476 domain-containing protein [Sphingobacteriaceae bacterium]|jgi:hypothetical protein
MKNKILLAIALFITVSSIAQDLGKVVIRNANLAYPKFIASINGVRMSNDYAANITFSMLEENAYRIKILQAGSTNMLTYTITSEPRYLSKYIITKDNMGYYSILLESKTLMLDEEPPVTTTTPTVAVVTAPVTAVTTSVLTVNPSAVSTGTTSTATVSSTSVTITPITSAEFNERLEAVKKTSFDKDRLQKAKQVLDDEYLKTDQVIEMVKVFSFDDSKLDFAKWAYSHTIDKKNYYKVEDHFSFNSSKTNLREYVKKQPK